MPTNPSTSNYKGKPPGTRNRKPFPKLARDARGRILPKALQPPPEPVLSAISDGTNNENVTEETEGLEPKKPEANKMRLLHIVDNLTEIERDILIQRIGSMCMLTLNEWHLYPNNLQPHDRESIQRTAALTLELLKQSKP